MDVFELEHAADPRIAPDGTHVVYERRSFDVMSDRSRSRLWRVGLDGDGHQPVTPAGTDARAPRWSPDGSRLAYLALAGGESQIFVRWMEGGQATAITHVLESPSAPSWSPDGRWIAFTMLVREEPEPFAKLPPKPEGAEWAAPAKVVRKLRYRADGAGYLPDGHRHVFVVPAEGGTPRQLTDGPYDHDGPLSWTPDGRRILCSANRAERAEYDPVDSEVWAIDVETAELHALTGRDGPDRHPVVSPDGERIAFVGFDDRLQGYQVTRLYVMDADGANRRELLPDLDRDVESPQWRPNGAGLYFQYDDRGVTKLAYVTLDGELQTVAEDVGGTSLGRPYTSGSFDVGPGHRLVYTHTDPLRPADVALARLGEETLLLTSLNEDLLAHRALGEVTELVTLSSFDARPVQSWVVKPPGFDPAKTYPLLLEIHGGPFANYGERFSAEDQLYAAAGYVVLYSNPRGSTSYGEEYGNLIHHAYPGHDYDDLMSAVDAVVSQGYVDPERLYVTGGSGGGVLTAWIVGKTDRFRAAVVAKPVINWLSFALTADAYSFFYKYWFPGYPWEHVEHYWSRSPLSLVGNVTTPTMLLTGEVDYRTPISESEQYYQALKLREVDAVMVRLPEASHGIAARPSYLVSKVAHVLRWFELHGGEGAGDGEDR
jgi:acylaminoacyl-peptidase